VAASDFNKKAHDTSAHTEGATVMVVARIPRRTLLQGVAATSLLTAFGRFGKAFAADLVVGALYVGPKTDYGWNQAHAEGVAALKNLEGVTLIEEERVPETVEVQNSMESMINFDGANLIFATSFGYWDHMLEVAKKYPDVQFLHAAPTVWEEGMPENAGSYNGYIDEAQYVSGIVAGHMSPTGRLGFVAAKPYPASIRNINSFTLGARSVNPNATTQVIFTGDWVLPVKEAESVNTLADQGIDVVTCHVDSPKVVIETAERRNIYSCGYHMNQAALAPKGYLTGAEWSWDKVYTDYVQWLAAGQSWPHMRRGGLKEGLVRNSPYGPAVTEAARKNADDVAAQFRETGYRIYTGPMKTNDGRTAIESGVGYDSNDLWLESMDWLVEGVIGSTQG
jgi:basic membrane protein A and related proteins